MLALGLGALLATPTIHANWLTKEIYKKVEVGDPLELHIANPPNHQAGDRRPAIVFFFGGGWRSGKPGQFYPYIQALSKEGVVAISAQYRTKNSHGANPLECVMDAKSAIRYVRENAEKLGVDPDRIVAGGGSAGGHVAACAAIDAAPQEGAENSAISFRPQALVLLNPVLSVGPEGYGHNYVRRFIDDWETISPLESVDSTFPPTLIQVGTVDKILPVAMAEEFEDKMKAAGNHVEVVFYEGASHGFFNKPEHQAPTIERIKLFLRSLGYME